MPPTTPSIDGAEPLGFVCNAPEGLNVRSEPGTDADILGTLAEGTAVQIERFMLETEANDAGIGSGWYKIASPLAGWVSSTYLSDIPALLTCLDNYTAAQQSQGGADAGNSALLDKTEARDEVVRPARRSFTGRSAHRLTESLVTEHLSPPC
jgi:uncharacterized protein YgiM (DUF1202 family)